VCGRYTLATDPDTLATEFSITGDPNLTQLEPSYNIAPSQPIPVVIQLPKQGRVLMFMRWGLVPSWAKEVNTKFSMINARAETLADKPAYKQPFRHRRCIIPADGFYEWKANREGKVPYYIRMEHGTPFGMAGLWEMRGDLYSCTIITTEPNSLMKPIHDRMPAILKQDDYEKWLSPKSTQPGDVQSLLKPYNTEDMECWPVSKLVNSPANNNVSLIDKPD